MRLVLKSVLLALVIQSVIWVIIFFFLDSKYGLGFFLALLSPGLIYAELLVPHDLPASAMKPYMQRYLFQGFFVNWFIYTLFIYWLFSRRKIKLP